MIKKLILLAIVSITILNCRYPSADFPRVVVDVIHTDGKCTLETKLRFSANGDLTQSRISEYATANYCNYVIGQEIK